MTETLQRELHRDPDPRLEALLEELERYITHPPVPADHLGFAVPLELATPHGPVRLLITLTTFATTTTSCSPNSGWRLPASRRLHRRAPTPTGGRYQGVSAIRMIFDVARDDATAC